MLPNRVYDLRLKLDPVNKLSRTETELPIAALKSNETVEPTRNQDRDDKADPIYKLSRIEME